MKIAIVPNMTRCDAPQTTLRVCQTLAELGICFFLPQSLAAEFAETRAEFLPEAAMLERCDLLLTVGGDGTILYAAKQAAKHGKPVLGINAGRLAFLAGLEANELPLLKNLPDGQYRSDSRLLLRMSILREAEILASADCVNDAVIHLAARRLSTELRVNLDGQFLNEYMGDGLIAATPTGSTAYSLSAGGPVVDPQLESILLTPICTHSLFSRSLLFRSDAQLTVESAAGKELSVSCDGEAPLLVPPDCQIHLAQSPYRAEFLRIKSDHFIQTLNQKLAQWRA